MNISSEPPSECGLIGVEMEVIISIITKVLQYGSRERKGGRWNKTSLKILLRLYNCMTLLY